MKILAKLLPLVLSGGVITASNADVPHSFVNGSEANATQVNENFSYLGERMDALEERIDTLDALLNGNEQNVSVDCSTDSTALAEYLHWDSDNFGKHEYTRFLLTGTCDGPLYIYGDGVRLQSADSNNPATLQLPAGVDVANDGEFVVMIDGAQRVRLVDLIIDVSLYASSEYEDNHVSGVLARTSFVRIVNSEVIGGIHGVNAFRNAVIRFEDENSITNFYRNGISAGVSSHIDVRDFVTVVANDVISDGGVAAIDVYDVSSVRIRNGSHIEFPVPPDYDYGSEIINVGKNSSLSFNALSDNSNVNNTVVGDMWIGDGGFLQMNNGTVIDGSIYARGGAVVDMKDDVLINGEVRFQLNSVLDIEPGGKINGDVRIRRNSSLLMEGNTTIDGDLYLRLNSSAVMFDDYNITGSIFKDDSSAYDAD